MIFKVFAPFTQIKSITENIYLIEDRWDDYGFQTMYDIWINSTQSGPVHVGKVKIGERGLTEGRPSIPQEFTELDSKKFFSVGQDDNYYLKLNDLGYGHTIPNALNDLAANPQDIVRHQKERCLTESLLRRIPSATVTTQFRRILLRGNTERHKAYEITYIRDQHEKAQTHPSPLIFAVEPGSVPPTNIHVLVGRNGVGKSTLLRDMARCLTLGNGDPKSGRFITGDDRYPTSAIFVSFSAFDPFVLEEHIGAAGFSINQNPYVPFHYVGLNLALTKSSQGKKLKKIWDAKVTHSERNVSGDEPGERLAEAFVESFETVASIDSLRDRWINVLENLRYDPIFENSGALVTLRNLVTEFKVRSNPFHFHSDISEVFQPEVLKAAFRRLSSGHAIVLLSLTKIVELTSEKTLVLMDEPEAHLHPPLMAAFLRCLSIILTDLNGTAVIATHSPVILQEVPTSCVWVLNRAGYESSSSRLDIETFGQSISVLTREVFGLEVSQTGFYSLITNAVERASSFEDVEAYFDCPLGNEASLLARTLWQHRKRTPAGQ